MSFFCHHNSDTFPTIEDKRISGIMEGDKEASKITSWRDLSALTLQGEICFPNHYKSFWFIFFSFFHLEPFKENIPYTTIWNFWDIQVTPAVTLIRKKPLNVFISFSKFIIINFWINKYIENSRIEITDVHCNNL